MQADALTEGVVVAGVVDVDVLATVEVGVEVGVVEVGVELVWVVAGAGVVFARAAGLKEPCDELPHALNATASAQTSTEAARILT